MDMLISIIVPTFEPGEYLNMCLQSIHNQTLESYNYEVIVVLNGCKDPYYKNIEAFFLQKNYYNYHLLYSERRGVSLARNMGLKAAKGNNIVFVDDDDLISPEFLEKLLIHSGEGIVVVSNFKVFKGSDNNECSDDYITRCYMRNKAKERNSLFYKRCFMSSVCAKLIPANAVIGRVFNENISNGEDGLYMYLISDKVSRIELAAEEAIYYRRVRENSLSRGNISSFVKIRQCFVAIYEYSVIYIKSPLKYSLIIYLARLVASIKRLMITIR
jgi:glycosyltransferase involved in cell wall biosynthesis